MSATVLYLDSIVTVRNATADSPGMVRPDGTTITVDDDGTIHGIEQTTIATTAVAGIVKPDGTTITVDRDGTMHGAANVPTATTSNVGTVMPDGTTITIDGDGVISAVGTGGPRWEVREDADGRRRLAIVIPEEE